MKWAVHLRRSGTFYSNFFSDNKYGGKEAFKRAVAARKAMIASLDERLYLKSSTAKRLARH